MVAPQAASARSWATLRCGGPGRITPARTNVAATVRWEPPPSMVPPGWPGMDYPLLSWSTGVAVRGNPPLRRSYRLVNWTWRQESSAAGLDQQHAGESGDQGEVFGDRRDAGAQRGGRECHRDRHGPVRQEPEAQHR